MVLLMVENCCQIVVSWSLVFAMLGFALPFTFYCVLNVENDAIL